MRTRPGTGTAGDEIGSWLDRIHDAYDEFAYRHVYAAYLAVRPPRRERRSGEVTLTAEPGGGHLLRAGSADPGLRLRDDAECDAFLAHLVGRYCRGRHSSMEEWEAAAHDRYVADLRGWE
ncbi:hypothetical protein HS048_31350 [Planomonospora sp. ID91781]|uniref:hypothetical protein n=1 Tax=Planomonospora sp. ID91781 TaxID=2738135 RepID=UPI0018C40297|nr:hypothetical protein [Planomonospora sp. ID91781]MBG0825190.1 hypothetical protein [Planomonospora sp. ID91781]